METLELRIEMGETGAVSGLLVRPDGAASLLVLGHGAGAGMRHRFMERVAAELAAHQVATLRYQFPYMEEGRKRPDPPARATATVIAAVERARQVAPELALFAGGKSFGGRMTSQAVVDGVEAGLRGLVFLGFPLHPAGRPGTDRADHLARVACPMLFVHGTRDALAGLDLLRPVVTGLGERAALHVVEGGDHSFGVLRRSGRAEADVMAEIGDVVASWIERQAAARDPDGPRASA